jgi:kinesin family protein 2/24
VHLPSILLQVVVVGLKEQIVEDVSSVKGLIEESNRQRSVGSTAANADSSRSHSIMQVRDTV